MEKLMSSIKSRLDKLLNTEYPKRNIIDFYISINSGCSSTAKLIIAYYITVNDDTNFNQIEQEVMSNERLINNYIDNIEEYTKYIDNNKFDFILSPFDNTPLSEERYHDILIEVFSTIIQSSMTIKNIFMKSSNKITFKLKSCITTSNIFQKINKKFFTLRKEANKFYSSIEIEQKALLELVEWLSKEINSDKIVYTPHNIIDKLNDDELIYEIQRVITSLNNDHFVHVYRKYKKLAHNNISYIRHLFKDIINASNIPKECLIIISKYGNLDKIISTLAWLNSLNLNIIDFTSEEGMEALISTNKEMLCLIYDLLQKGVISEHFIIKNPSVLYNENLVEKRKDGNYDKLAQNYNLLRQNKINIDNTCINEILLLAKEYITQAINQFNNYDLNKDIKVPKSMFTNKKFFNYIDLFIELGMYDYIKDNFNIIDDNCDNIIKRIYISKMMRLNIFDSKGKLLSRIITGNDFYVPNDSLDNYIISVSNQMIDSNLLNKLNNLNTTSNSFNDELIDFDRHFTLNKATYNFNNILISRNKVLRNYNYLRSIYPNYDKWSLLESSIIHNSILDIQGIYTIKDLFDDFCSIKQKKI